jgi:hypothetical protein
MASGLVKSMVSLFVFKEELGWAVSMVGKKRPPTVLLRWERDDDEVDLRSLRNGAVYVLRRVSYVSLAILFFIADAAVEEEVETEEGEEEEDGEALL